MSPFCKLHPFRIDTPIASDHSNRQDAFKRVGTFVIADFSADVFNQIKLIIDDHSDSGFDNESDNGTHAFTVDAEDDENDPSDAEFNEEASNGTSAMPQALTPSPLRATKRWSPTPMTRTFRVIRDLIPTEDEAGMEDRLNFSTPTGPYEGHENIAVDTLVDEDMADNAPTQEGMGNDSLFSSVAGSDKGQHLF